MKDHEFTHVRIVQAVPSVKGNEEDVRLIQASSVIRGAGHGAEARWRSTTRGFAALEIVGAGEHGHVSPSSYNYRCNVGTYAASNGRWSCPWQENPARSHRSFLVAAGVSLVIVGLCFILVRPPLLAEDLRYRSLPVAEFAVVRPQLESWLTHVFQVMGGTCWRQGC